MGPTMQDPTLSTPRKSTDKKIGRNMGEEFPSYQGGSISDTHAYASTLYRVGGIHAFAQMVYTSVPIPIMSDTEVDMVRMMTRLDYEALPTRFSCLTSIN